MLLQYKLSRPGGQIGPECPGQITQIAWSICPGITHQFNPEVGRFTSVTWSVCPGTAGQASRNALVKYQRNTLQHCPGTHGQFQRYTQVINRWDFFMDKNYPYSNEVVAYLSKTALFIRFINPGPS